jgi:hypothetical protein
MGKDLNAEILRAIIVLFAEYSTARFKLLILLSYKVMPCYSFLFRSFRLAGRRDIAVK